MVISALAGLFTLTPVFWNFHTHAFNGSLKGKRLQIFSSKLPSVKKILFPAEELIRYYQSEGYGFNPGKIQIIHNSGQSPSNHPGLNPGEKSEKTHIGYVGRLVALKRVHLLVGLTEYLISRDIANFFVEIVGDGPEKESLEKEVNEKKFSGFIKFHGFQEDTDSFYRHFDIFVSPSEEEVLSLSLIDAGLSGIASVAFNIGGNHEIITNGVTGYLADSVEEFYSIIADLINDAEFRKKLGTSAREHTKLRFSHESRLKNLTRLYAQFL
jgi:glycosyltransferase involved in cell wall biosynthesis